MIPTLIASGGPASAGDWPVRAGAVPPLAHGYVARPESAPGLLPALAPGAAVALVPGRETPGEWPGSCGTTQLAADAAESLWRSGELDLLAWVTATSRASVMSGLAQAAAAVTGASPATGADPAAAWFARWLGDTRRRWLVVLDDLADLADLEDLEGLWPQSPAGRLLITATRAAGLAGERRVLRLPVGAFSIREAMDYLMGRLAADPEQRIGALDLAESLSGEPLALDQACAVILSLGQSCRDYRDRFLRRRDYLAEMTGTGPAPTACTWTLCADEADRLAAGARPALALAALLDGHGIPGEIFTAPAALRYLAGDDAVSPAGPGQARTMLRVLRQAGLLTTTATGPGTPPLVLMTAAVQAAVRAAAPPAVLSRAASAAAAALAQSWPDTEPLPWDAAALRSCAATLQRAAGDQLWAGGYPGVALRAGRSLDAARLTGPALTHWTDLMHASGRILGQRHPDTLLIGGHLAAACLAADRQDEAVRWRQWALACLADEAGPDHPATITARRDLGLALAAAGNPGDAITALGAAAGAADRVLGAGHPITLAAQDDLAAAYLAAGNPAQAIGLFRHTLTARERARGPRDRDTIATRQHLAGACLAAGRLKEATTAYRRALADSELFLGPDHPDTISARGDLGAAYHAAGRMAAAVQLYEQACAGCERVLGPDHPDTLARRVNLARAYEAIGRLGDGLAVLRDTITRCERVLPPHDPLTQAVRQGLANLTSQ